MNADPSFLPSHVTLKGAVALTDCFGHAELEAAATMMVRTCQVKGDQWQSVAPKTMGEVLDVDIETDTPPLSLMKKNPFYPFPDFHGLVEEGFAEFHIDWTKNPPIRFTQKGLRAMRKKVHKPCPKCSLPSICMWWANNTDLFAREGRGPVVGGWAAHHRVSFDEGRRKTINPVVPKMLSEDLDFDIVAWKHCREIFDCPQHGEFGLLESAPPFFYEPDTYVTGPNGEKLFRL